MPAPLTTSSPTAAVEFNKLIEEVFVSPGASINCGALRRILQQLTSIVQSGSGGNGKPCTCYCSTSRVTIDNQSPKKSPSKTKKLSARPSSSKTSIKGGNTRDKEHEIILSKLQVVQTTLKAMQQKINQIETRLPKAQSNVSLGKGGGRRRQTSKASSVQFGKGSGEIAKSVAVKKHCCGASRPPSAVVVGPPRIC